MKKIAAITICMMLLSIFTACGSKDEENNRIDSSNEKNVNSAAIEDENKSESVEVKADITLSLGHSHSACISDDGKLLVWGNNDDDRLALKTTEIVTEHEIPISSIPVELEFIGDSGGISSVCLGSAHSAVITKDGSLYMWGNNGWWECGVGGYIHTQSTPEKILNDVVKVSLGRAFSAAITKDGSLYMWGDNEYGIYGNGTVKTSSTPTKVMDNVKDIACGYDNTAILTNDGILYACGSNYFEQLGVATKFTSEIVENNGQQIEMCISSTPIKVMDNVESISCGGEHMASITKDGELYMWGDNCYGQLGADINDNTADQSTFKFCFTPTKIMDNVKQVSLGQNHSAVVTQNDDLYMWGLNDMGQLGITTSETMEEGGETVSISSYPLKVMSNINYVSLGGNHSAAITNDGCVYTWGSNKYGQLGNGTTEDSPKPIKIMDDVMLSKG